MCRSFPETQFVCWDAKQSRKWTNCHTGGWVWGILLVSKLSTYYLYPTFRWGKKVTHLTNTATPEKSARGAQKEMATLLSKCNLLWLLKAQKVHLSYWNECNGVGHWCVSMVESVLFICLFIAIMIKKTNSLLIWQKGTSYLDLGLLIMFIWTDKSITHMVANHSVPNRELK